MSHVRVEIDGHTYRMACADGEEARVTTLAGELDGTIHGLRARVGEIGDRRIAVMAALTVLDQLRTAEAQVAELTAKAAQLERARERAVVAAEAEDEPLIARIEAVTEAVDRLSRMIHGEVRAVRDEDRPRDPADPVPASFSRTPRPAPGPPAMPAPVARTAGSEAAGGAEPGRDGLDTMVPSFLQRP